MSGTWVDRIGCVWVLKSPTDDCQARCGKFEGVIAVELGLNASRALSYPNVV